MHVCFSRALLVCVLASVWANRAPAQLTTTRVSVASSGAQANGLSSQTHLSADGRCVIFSSVATNLVAGDTNGKEDVFVHDRQSGVTSRVSVSSGGAQGDNWSANGTISADGRYVAFDSVANNLVAGDSHGVQDVFVHDRVTAVTTRVSLDPAGGQLDNASWVGALSDDGRWLTFGSAASTVVANDTNALPDLFLRDLQTATTTRINVSSAGAESDAESRWVVISGDAAVVVFSSDASNLVTGDSNACRDVFVHDPQTAITTRVSVSSLGVEGNFFAAYYAPAVSRDGRYVAFDSLASNLVSGDTNATQDIFVRDRQAGTTRRASVDSQGVGSDSISLWPSLTADGQRVFFHSLGSNLVAGDTNAAFDVFERDFSSGSTRLVSTRANGFVANAHSSNARISGDGRFLAFKSDASNLVATDTNGASDIFVRELVGEPPFAYCTAGTTSHGCVPAIGFTGAPSASAGSGFTISVTALEGQKQALLFYGIDNTGFAPDPWGTSTSWLCVKSPVQRGAAQSSGGTFNACDGALAVDWNAFIAATPNALGNPFAAGQLVFAQCWFRDPPSAKTTALSDALEFLVGP